MVQKYKIANLIFFVALCYIISPWFFEKFLFFNEFLSATGLLVLLYKRLPLVKTRIYIYLALLIALCIGHCILSILRMDSFYYYLRNTVIMYSMFTFFIGFFCLHYLGRFITAVRGFLRYYISFLLVVPLSNFLFERYGMATIFPALLKDGRKKMVLPLLIFMNIIYAITYSSSTSFILSMFYFLLLISVGYKFFKQVMVIILLLFIGFFVSILPNLSLIQVNYSIYNENAIHNVMSSNKILGLDPNNTWRLVLWKQFLIDLFPANILGIGFGTPAIHYFPVADMNNVNSLPYVLGAHNSFIYLFSRLGIIYLLLMVLIYSKIFKEYFYQKQYYKSNNEVFIFYSFFAISIISLFNPTLESPIFAGGYWLVLGFVARSIYNRQVLLKTKSENIIHS